MQFIFTVIIGQIILARNCPDLDNYTVKVNEVIIYVHLYNTETGHFRSTKKMVRIYSGPGRFRRSFLFLWI